MKNFLKEYRVEIITAIIAILGIFLLVERIEIRASLLNFSSWLYTTGKELALEGFKNLSAYITAFTVSDFIGWILLILAGAFIIWRVRYRFLRSRFWRIKNCPRCGSPLHRIHRTPFQRFLTRFFLPNGCNYLCANKDCGWSGLRRRIRHKRASQVHLPDEFD